MAWIFLLSRSRAAVAASATLRAPPSALALELAPYAVDGAAPCEAPGSPGNAIALASQTVLPVPPWKKPSGQRWHSNLALP